VKQLFPNYYYLLDGQEKFNWMYLAHIVKRATNFLIVFWAMVMSIYYARLAGINFGIISCCYCVSIIFNSVCCYFFFREVITLKMLFGMVVTLTGIIWISLAKG
jgi:drug/metabolite transporter (DMT)-like permease